MKLKSLQNELSLEIFLAFHPVSFSHSYCFSAYFNEFSCSESFQFPFSPSYNYLVLVSCQTWNAFCALMFVKGTCCSFWSPILWGEKIFFNGEKLTTWLDEVIYQGQVQALGSCAFPTWDKCMLKCMAMQGFLNCISSFYWDSPLVTTLTTRCSATEWCDHVNSNFCLCSNVWDRFPCALAKWLKKQN